MIFIEGGRAQYDWQIKLFRAHMDDGSIILAPTLDRFAEFVPLTAQELTDLQEMKDDSPN